MNEVILNWPERAWLCIGSLSFAVSGVLLANFGKVKEKVAGDASATRKIQKSVRIWRNVFPNQYCYPNRIVVNKVLICF